MSLSTHVLDTATGTPAAGIGVVAEHGDADGWVQIGRGRTDGDGRIAPLVGRDLGVGPHRLTFEVGAYYHQNDTPAFWGDIVITFIVSQPTEHHHVPLLLSPYGYSTYRGS